MQAEKVRFTIAVDEDVHRAFAEMAHASGVSLSRCVGDWLRDTSEAAHLTTVKLKQVRTSPQEAFQAFNRAMAEDIPRTAEKIAQTAWGSAAGGRGGFPPAGGTATGGSADLPVFASPPPSNTGGKVPQDHRKSPSKKRRGF